MEGKTEMADLLFIILTMTATAAELPAASVGFLCLCRPCAKLQLASLLTLCADKATDTASDDAPLVSMAGTTACSTSSTSIADAWDTSLIAILPTHSACVRSASTTMTANWSSMSVSMPSLSASRQCLSQASYPNFASAVAIIE